MNQREIAKLCNVSVATVSRVLNGSPHVDPDTRAAIETVLEKNGYVMDINARNLRRSKVPTLGFIVSNFSNVLFPPSYQGIESVCSKHGYNIIVGITNNDEKTQKEAIELLLSYKVRGIIGTFVSIDKSTIQRINNSQCRIVCLGREQPALKADLVRCDNESGGTESVKYLAGLGHRDIACIYGAPDSVGLARKAGFEAAMAELSLPIRPGFLIGGGYRETQTYAAVSSLLALPKRPTAIVAQSYAMGIGAYKAICDQGLSIPEDISLVIFESFPLSDYLCGGLTVVDQPSRKMGEIAAQMLFDRIDGAVTEDRREVVVPMTLIPGKSCMPPRE